MDVPLYSWRPNTELATALRTHVEPPPEHHYLYADEQKRVVEQLAMNYSFIVAMALRGKPSKVIAATFGVSREAIDRKLRPLGLKNPPGVRGRPKLSPPAASQY